MTWRVRVRVIDDDEGQRLLRIIRRGSGSVVTWRRAQMVLLSAQGTDEAPTGRRFWAARGDAFVSAWSAAALAAEVGKGKFPGKETWQP